MAQYRYSAQIIGRSAGKSATAAAAYRAAEAIADERTGMIHDYSRKSGVVHTEIMSPQNTPAWMHDRAQLWNAVERVEKRKDSQLAREILLSLPHEITAEQRRDLVRAYVAETYVKRGLIADVAIHRPDKGEDHRNHHAHIMLTTRSLTGEGFGPKIREGKQDQERRIRHEREQWAAYQNRTFERLGLDLRVDHRSYSDRAIDREPTQHMGPHAAKLERQGEISRIGDRNREIEQDNTRRAHEYRLSAEQREALRTLPYQQRQADPITPIFNYRSADHPMTRREKAFAERAHQAHVELERRARLARLDLEQKLHPQIAGLEGEQRGRNAVFKATIRAEIDAIDRRAEAKGVTRFFRKVGGWEAEDRLNRRLHEMTLAKLAEREAEERRGLDAEHRRQLGRLDDHYKKLHAKLEKTVAYQQAGREQARTLHMNRDDEGHRADKRGQPPKPELNYEPKPPPGAAPARTRGDEDRYNQKVRDWASSPEGRAQLAKSPAPARNDWRHVSSQERPASSPAPERLPPHERPRDASQVPAPERSPPTPAKEWTREARPTPERQDFWRASNREQPSRDRTRDRDRD